MSKDFFCEYKFLFPEISSQEKKWKGFKVYILFFRKSLAVIAQVFGESKLCKEVRHGQIYVLKFIPIQ